MQATKWITLVTVLVLVNGQDEFPVNPDTQNYQYHYFVRDENTGDIKSHEEKKLGDIVNGQYTVGEPNGDLRVVTYTADEGGFRANVKYEEGGSPLSDKSSQTNAKSGVDFQWIPGNPDDIGGTAEKTEDGNEEPKTEESTEGISTEATAESNSETEETSEKSSSEEKGPSDENEAGGEKPFDKDSESESSSESKSEGDSEGKESGPKDGDNEDNDNAKEDEKSPISKESSEEKDTKEPEEKEESEENEESAEAAESAPESEEVAATEPSQMYLPLPVLPYPSMPFLNMPTENQQRENDRPTIIYASQNFYNPWQWFSTKRIVREEQPPLDDEQAGHYMTGLGYIIVPRQQQ